MGNRKRRGVKSRPDRVEKLLEDYNDVFADIINVLVYDGREEVRPEDLVDGPAVSHYKAAEGDWRERTRDVCKEDVRNGATFAVWGLENQSKVSFVMPVRCMGYDYAAYGRMVEHLKAKNKEEGREADYAAELHPGQHIWPAITLVLYFGTKPWDGPVTLHEMMDIPEDLRAEVPDYRIHLVEVAFLPEETIAKFKSDFQVVASLFRAKRLGKEREMKYNTKKWDHVAELMEFFRTFTGDARYETCKAKIVERSRKGEVIMCSVVDTFVEMGVQEGIKQGIEKGMEQGIEMGIKQGVKKGMEKGMEKGMGQGLIEGRYRSLQSLVKNTGMSLPEAMDALSFSKKERKGYKKWLKANKEKDPEKRAGMKKAG